MGRVLRTPRTRTLRTMSNSYCLLRGLLRLRSSRGNGTLRGPGTTRTHRRVPASAELTTALSELRPAAAGKKMTPRIRSTGANGERGEGTWVRISSIGTSIGTSGGRRRILTRLASICLVLLLFLSFTLHSSLEDAGTSRLLFSLLSLLLLLGALLLDASSGAARSGRVRCSPALATSSAPALLLSSFRSHFDRNPASG